MNLVILMGRLGQDPDMRMTASGKQVANFSLATDNGKDKDPSWHKCIAWEKLAEITGKYLRKGSQVLIRGRINYRKHEEKYYTDIVCHEIEFVGSRDQAGAEANSQGGYQGQGRQAPPAAHKPPDFNEDSDVPF